MAWRKIRVNNRETWENTKTGEAWQKVRINNRETWEQPSWSRKVKEDKSTFKPWMDED